MERNMAIGIAAEEKLVNLLNSKGYKAYRLSSTPRGKIRDPDVVAFKDDLWIAYEVKTILVSESRVVHGKEIRVYHHVTVKKGQLAKCFRWLRNKNIKGQVNVAVLFRKQSGCEHWCIAEIPNARRDVKIYQENCTKEPIGLKKQDNKLGNLEGGS